MLTVTIVISLVTLSLGMREKIGKELRQYGSNMIVTGRSGDYIDESTAIAVKNISDYVYEASFQLYGSSFIEGSAFEIIGMDIGKLKGFRLDGALPEKGSEILIGTNIKDVLNVKKGDLLRFDDNKELRFKVTGIFEKGSDEDSAVIMSLKDVRSLLGVEGVSVVLLNADTDYIDDITGRLKAEHPLLEVKTLKQVAVAEKKILGKIQLLMLIVTAVVLFSSIIGKK
jgi:ABC-type lipoprotein release transport system permease subunit